MQSIQDRLQLLKKGRIGQRSDRLLQPAVQVFKQHLYSTTGDFREIRDNRSRRPLRYTTPRVGKSSALEPQLRTYFPPSPRPKGPASLGFTKGEGTGSQIPTT